MDDAARLLVIYTSASESWGQISLAEALVRKLCALGIAGATAHTGSMSFGKFRKVREHSAVGADEHRPTTVMAVDAESKLLEAVPHLRALAPENTMLLLPVEVVPRRGDTKRTFESTLRAVVGARF
jgi:PII-like signaling protein